LKQLEVDRNRKFECRKIQQFSIDLASKNKRLQTKIPLLLYVTGAGARYHPLNKFVNLNLCPSLTNFVVTVQTKLFF
ncbi:MAG: hypothetical protein ACTSO9_16300, partial [Candidatus Helarchaeota archaeon]